MTTDIDACRMAAGTVTEHTGARQERRHAGARQERRRGRGRQDGGSMDGRRQGRHRYSEVAEAVGTQAKHSSKHTHTHTVQYPVL